MAQFPEVLVRSKLDLRSQFSAGLRVIFEGNHAIYYTVSEAEIIIIRVLHGARDANALAERGGFE
ncbi:type II toxin-antitoxin system RelE/ParE family toxin [Nostoc sp.]|uniref:type II toxin-antitoxin system RelE/ParE family toxin n=1 Tax=Nostoc sp. TaxID=1180 RepID=UPI002FFC9206